MAIEYPKTRMDNFFAKAAGSELADDSMEPITDREYWINEMAKKTAGGGLPTIEEGDDGKVLTASDGQAVWASGGGGGGVTMTIVNVSVNDQDAQVLDKNYNQIKAILESGNLAETFFDNEVGDYNYNLIVAYGTFDDEGTTIYYVKNIASEIFESDSPTGVLTYE